MNRPVLHLYKRRHWAVLYSIFVWLVLHQISGLEIWVLYELTRQKQALNQSEAISGRFLFEERIC